MKHSAKSDGVCRKSQKCSVVVITEDTPTVRRILPLISYHLEPGTTDLYLE